MIITFIYIQTGVCALNGKLYVVGGSDPYGRKGLKNCDVFDPITKSWTSCAPLNIRKFVALFLKENFNVAAYVHILFLIKKGSCHALASLCC